MQVSFKTENPQFLSELWTAPAFRILPQETTLDSLQDCVAGGFRLEPVGWKGTIPDVVPLGRGPGTHFVRGFCFSDAKLLERTRHCKPQARYLFITWNFLFLFMKSATLGVI